MTPDSPHKPDLQDIERLARYAEGDLSEAERLAMDAELRERPELAAMLERMQGIDNDLRAHFGGPTPASLPHPAITMARRVLGVAALVAIVGVLAVMYFRTPVTTVQLAHARTVLEGSFEPVIVCDTPEKFRRYGIDVFDVPLTADFAAADDAGITLVGWVTYMGRYDLAADAGDRPVRALLARGPQDERIIAVFRPKNTLRFETGDTGGYTLHSARIGGLVVDEISTLPDPVVLPLLGARGD